MLFNSIEFIFFLIIVYCLHWVIIKNNYYQQNIILLVSSYVFYGWWDWRFLALIFLSTFVDFSIGLKIFNSNNVIKKKIFLSISVLLNLALLGFFKYFNFFIDSWMNFLSSLGYENYSYWSLNIILPVGISFYTFQTMSYSLDIYYEKLKPTKDFISFATFVCFFPQLVAGPIERASKLLPQILNIRIFNYTQSVQGLRLILWGMFKKVVIADSLGHRVDFIFDNYTTLDSVTLILGLIYFAFQIYCDFSGYSDIAIGTSKLFGIELMSNFNFPYFSRNISEFWKRWHISLSSWFKDYVYIPLGGSKKSTISSVRNIFIIFTVSGFWHGANWTFIVWGIIHSLFYIPLFLVEHKNKTGKNIVAHSTQLPSLKEFFQICTTFIITTSAWVFFRSDSVYDAFNYMYKIFEKPSFSLIHTSGLIFVSLILFFDWLSRGRERSPINYKNKYLRWLTYFFIYNSIVYFYDNQSVSFIYFQF